MHQSLKELHQNWVPLSDATGSDISQCGFDDAIDTWHVWTSDFTGEATFTTLGTTDLDTTLAIYDGCGGAELGCNDDASEFESVVVLPVEQGATYRIRVAGFDGDTGSYELTVVPKCPWDCGDVDGVVGINDFLTLLAQWGMTGTSCDFDGAGVGINDFLLLLANWGPCP